MPSISGFGVESRGASPAGATLPSPTAAGQILYADATPSWVASAAPVTPDANANAIIVPSATTKKPVVIQGLAGQTANLFEIQKSTGVPLLKFTAAGKLAISDAAFTPTGDDPGIVVSGSGLGSGATPGITFYQTDNALNAKGWNLYATNEDAFGRGLEINSVDDDGSNPQVRFLITTSGVRIPSISTDGTIYFATGTNGTIGSDPAVLFYKGTDPKALGVGTNTPQTFIGGLAQTANGIGIRGIGTNAAFVSISGNGASQAANLYFETTDGTATARLFRAQKFQDVLRWQTLNEATGATVTDNVITFDLYGNVGIGTSTYEANAFNGGHLLIRNNAGHPSTGVADTVQLYCDDRVAGEAGLKIRDETNAVVFMGKISNLFKGADVADAATITATGNIFVVTGTGTQIDTLSATGIVAGTEVTLIFASATVVVGDLTGNINISAAYVSTVRSTLKLVYDGTNWLEVSRSLN